MLYNAIHLVAVVGRPLVGVLVPPGVPEDDLFSIPLLLNHLLAHAVEFGEIDHPLPVGEVGHNPLPPLLVPLGVVYDGLELVIVHENADDGLELLNLFLLIPDGVKKLLLLLLVLVLNVPEFDQVGRIFLLDLLKPLAHLVNFLIQTFVVLLDMQQLVLPPLLLLPELLLLFLLHFQLLLQLFNLLHLAFVLIVRSLPLEVLLQTL